MNLYIPRYNEKLELIEEEIVTAQDFHDLLNFRIECIRLTLGSKAKEYALGGDRLHNFKVAARMDGKTPEQALWGMSLKHRVSVEDMVEERLPLTRELINEKIGDAINYLILLEAILKEKLEKADEKIDVHTGN